VSFENAFLVADAPKTTMTPLVYSVSSKGCGIVRRFSPHADILPKHRTLDAGRRAR
jgi:hypothetical protein